MEFTLINDSSLFFHKIKDNLTVSLYHNIKIKIIPLKTVIREYSIKKEDKVMAKNNKPLEDKVAALQSEMSTALSLTDPLERHTRLSEIEKNANEFLQQLAPTRGVSSGVAKGGVLASGAAGLGIGLLLASGIITGGGSVAIALAIGSVGGLLGAVGAALPVGIVMQMVDAVIDSSANKKHAAASTAFSPLLETLSQERENALVSIPKEEVLTSPSQLQIFKENNPKLRQTFNSPKQREVENNTSPTIQTQQPQQAATNSSNKHS